MTKHNDPCREAFEDWYTQGDLKCRSIVRAKNHDGYVLAGAHLSWTGWQAAWTVRGEHDGE